MLFAPSYSASAQQPKKVARIGYLSGGDTASDSARSAAIRLALGELGYIEGQNIAIEYRYAEGKLDRLPELAAELVRLKVDIIVVTAGGSWIRAVKNAAKTIPIVMVGRGIDPVEGGLVKSLASPGGNVTGITNLSREPGGKRLELLKEAVPKLARVAVFFDPANLASVGDVREVLPVAARALRLTLQAWEIRAADGQNTQGRQARRSAGGAAHEVRVRHQSENCQADRPDDSAGGARSGEQADQVITSGVPNASSIV